MTESLNVEVWSDVVCPWCYIGKRRLEAAVATSGVPVRITWRSFQLDPSAPRQGTEDVAAYLGRKYGGGRAAGQAMNARVGEVAAGVGLDFHFERMQRANTGDAHRLLHLAAEHGLQGELKERLLSAYFVEGRAVGTHESLTELAVEAGLPPDRVGEVLATDEFAAQVDADQREAVSLGANGVPFFVMGRRVGVSGAQPTEVFARALQQAWDEVQPTRITPVGAVPADSSSEVCGPDGC